MNLILKFLDAYKSLDEICKQILSSNRGISEYIDEMNNVNYRAAKIAGWENDYKTLKRMRWIRNQLVHDTDSFNNIHITEADIKWLQNFRLRILHQKDPFSLVYQLKNSKIIINPKMVQKNTPIINSPKLDMKFIYTITKTMGIIFLIIIIIAIAIFFTRYS